MTDRKRPQIGDLYSDNDRRIRDNGGRIVKVVDTGPLAIPPNPNRDTRIETVEHWNETRIGKKRWVNGDRLANSAHLAHGYTKVSH